MGYGSSEAFELLVRRHAFASLLSPGSRRTLRTFTASPPVPQMCSSLTATLPSHSIRDQRLTSFASPASLDGSRAQQVSPISSTSPR